MILPTGRTFVKQQCLLISNHCGNWCSGEAIYVAQMTHYHVVFLFTYSGIEGVVKFYGLSGHIKRIALFEKIPIPLLSP